jgi:hypothetical protein
VVSVAVAAAAAAWLQPHWELASGQLAAILLMGEAWQV